jgi:hypothetical protein
MSSPVEVLAAGRAALRVAGQATVFAAFERSCYVEKDGAIACLGGEAIGLGPLNAIVETFEFLPVGTRVSVDLSEARPWQPPPPGELKEFPALAIPPAIRTQAEAFLRWISGSGRPDDTLIGRGPGLTPAGDDFVGGAMIALRACGRAELAGRIAGWALPLAKERTNRISHAHLECASRGEGHEFLHALLSSTGEKESLNNCLERLARIGHTSGLDAAAGALLALERCGTRTGSGR